MCDLATLDCSFNRSGTEKDSRNRSLFLKDLFNKIITYFRCMVNGCTPTFTDQIFSILFFTSFTDNFFSRWLHLNNLYRKSIAQDCMQVLQIFAMATYNLTYFRETNRDQWSKNFFVSESRVTHLWNASVA